MATNTRKRRLWLASAALAVSLICGVVASVLRPSVWSRARDGSLIGQTLDGLGWTRGAGKRDSESRLRGWDVTYTGSPLRLALPDIDEVGVAAFRLNDQGVVTASGYFELNIDRKTRPIIRSQTVWPKDAPGLTFE